MEGNFLITARLCVVKFELITYIIKALNENPPFGGYSGIRYLVSSIQKKKTPGISLVGAFATLVRDSGSAGP